MRRLCQQALDQKTKNRTLLSRRQSIALGEEGIFEPEVLGGKGDDAHEGFLDDGVHALVASKLLKDRTEELHNLVCKACFLSLLSCCYLWNSVLAHDGFEHLRFLSLQD